MADAPNLAAADGNSKPDTTLAHVSSSISVDLVQASRSLIHLLIAVDTFPLGGLYDGPFVTEAVRRYEELWLPLLANASPDVAPTLVPPLDVAYAWLCHRLSPHAYASDCKRLFGKELDPAPEQALAFGDGLFGSRSWDTTRHFPGVYWPPLPQLVQATRRYKRGIEQPTIETVREAMSQLRQKGNTRSADSQLSYDVAAAMSRQGTFLRHVLKAAYCEQPFLLRAADRYHRFLVLWQEKVSEKKLVPMYDIDLMWHAHMAYSRAYREDMQRISGKDKILDHDDNIEHKHLREGFAATKAAFEARFDMLYDPPLTCKVPKDQQHPAVGLVGPRLLSALGAPSLALLQLRLERLNVGAKLNELRAVGHRVDSHVLKYLKARFDETRQLAAFYHDSLKTHKKFDIPQRQERNGGHALYVAYLLQRGLDKRSNSVLHSMLGSRHVKKSAAKYAVRAVKAITKFDTKYAPFRHDHPFFASLTLLPYDSPLTTWRTPPGSAPGSLKWAWHMAQHMRSQPPPSQGTPVQLQLVQGTPVQLQVVQAPVKQSRPAVNRVRSNQRDRDVYYPWMAYSWCMYWPGIMVTDPLPEHYSTDDLFWNPSMCSVCCHPGYCPYDMSALGGEHAATQEASQVADALQQGMAAGKGAAPPSDLLSAAAAPAYSLMDLTSSDLHAALGPAVDSGFSNVPGQMGGGETLSAACGGACVGSSRDVGDNIGSGGGGGGGGCGGGGGSGGG